MYWQVLNCWCYKLFYSLLYLLLASNIKCLGSRELGKSLQKKQTGGCELKMESCSICIMIRDDHDSFLPFQIRESYTRHLSSLISEDFDPNKCHIYKTTHSETGSWKKISLAVSISISTVLSLTQALSFSLFS